MKRLMWGGWMASVSGVSSQTLGFEENGIRRLVLIVAPGLTVASVTLVTVRQKEEST
jgi:hypothetical protein